MTKKYVYNRTKSVYRSPTMAVYGLLNLLEVLNVIAASSPGEDIETWLKITDFLKVRAKV